MSEVRLYTGGSVGVCCLFRVVLLISDEDKELEVVVSVGVVDAVED